MGGEGFWEGVGGRAGQAAVIVGVGGQILLQSAKTHAYVTCVGIESKCTGCTVYWKVLYSLSWHSAEPCTFGCVCNLKGSCVKAVQCILTVGDSAFLAALYGHGFGRVCLQV